MPAHGVHVQPETPAQLANVVAAGRGAQLLDDPHPMRIGQRTADGELAHLHETYRWNSRARISKFAYVAVLLSH